MHRVARVMQRVALLVCIAAASACGGGESSGGTGVVVGGETATVRILPASRTVGVGGTTTFTAEALDANGNVLSGKSFQFQTTNSTIATVVDERANPATFTALANGTVQIRAVSALGIVGTATLIVGGQAAIQISGRVIDGQTQAGLAGALVEFFEGTTSTTRPTAADGSYSHTFTFSSSGQTTIRASLSGYVGTELRTTITPTTTTVEPLVLVRQSASTSTISGTVRNARDNSAIAGAVVTLVGGQGPGAAQGFGQITTNGQGAYSFTNLNAGTYTASAQPAGFSPCARTAISVGPPAVANQDIQCSPANSTDIRIVLTWGDAPRDLDSHLTLPIGTAGSSNRFHVFYSNRGVATAEPFAVLDVDDTSSVGPETITLTQVVTGVYRYSVHDFTNRTSGTSAELGRSGAKVELYLPSVTTPMVFFVPNQPGTLWTVFELQGPAVVATVTPVNTMGSAQDSASIP